MIPLDQVLTSTAIKAGAGPVFGGRVSRALARGLRLVFALEISSAAPTLTAAAIGEVDASRAAFAATFQNLFDRGLLSVTSTATIEHA